VSVVKTQAQQLYTATDLGPLVQCEYQGPVGTSINNQGDVAFYCGLNAGSDIYFHTGRQVTFGGDSAPSAINIRDEVVGVNYESGSGYFYKNGQTTWFPPYTFDPSGINNKGMVVGNKLYNSSFTWQSGVLTDLNQKLHASSSTANAINDRGNVVGNAVINNAYLAYLLHASGKITRLPPVNGNVIVTPVAINKYDEVVGWWGAPGGYFYPFLWANHQLYSLGGTAQASRAQPTAINNLSVVVGYANYNPPNTVPDCQVVGVCRALIWEENSSGYWPATDLNTLLSPSDPLYGNVAMVYAASINDVGQILVIATYTQGPKQNQATTLILNPVVTNPAVAQ
jgi:hypothetical protein